MAPQLTQRRSLHYLIQAAGQRVPVAVVVLLGQGRVSRLAGCPATRYWRERPERHNHGICAAGGHHEAFLPVQVGGDRRDRWSNRCPEAGASALCW